MHGGLPTQWDIWFSIIVKTATLAAACCSTGGVVMLLHVVVAASKAHLGWCEVHFMLE
jgi:hypothetical protein